MTDTERDLPEPVDDRGTDYDEDDTAEPQPVDDRGVIVGDEPDDTETNGGDGEDN